MNLDLCSREEKILAIVSFVPSGYSLRSIEIGEKTYRIAQKATKPLLCCKSPRFIAAAPPLSPNPAPSVLTGSIRLRRNRVIAELGMVMCLFIERLPLHRQKDKMPNWIDQWMKLVSHCRERCFRAPLPYRTMRV
jgi:hypothetical protein